MTRSPSLNNQRLSLLVFLFQLSFIFLFTLQANTNEHLNPGFTISGCDSIALKEDTISPSGIKHYLTLPDKVKENSGLLFFNGHIWTHNDSGGENAIFAIDTANGRIKRKVIIAKEHNHDWEELTQDTGYIYIGNFGNNFGKRQDLAILKVKKKAILNKDTVEAETIAFSYPEQTNFKARLFNHNYDCEAMISEGDSLYLFTKNRANKQTNLYRLPKSAGSYKARLIDSLNIKGLVTAATYHPNDKLLFLLGYHGTLSFEPFIVILYNYPGNAFFRGCQLKLHTNMSSLGQTEGIFWHPPNKLFFSNEKGWGKAPVIRSIEYEIDPSKNK